MADSMLDNPDLDTLLKKALARYNEEETSPWRTGLSSMGLAMLAGNQNGGNLWQSLGRGGLLGMEAMQAEKTRQQKDPAQLVSLLSAVDTMKQKQLERAAMAQFQKDRTGLGGAGYGPPAPPMGPQSDVGPGDYAGPVTPPMQVPQMPPPPTGGARDNMTRQVMEKWRFSDSPAVREMAKSWIDDYEKYKPKIKEVTTLTQIQDGKPQRVKVMIMEDGSIQPMPSYGPDLEKPVATDYGKGIRFSDAYDPNKVIAEVPKTLTPGEQQTDIRTTREGALNRAQSAQIARDQLNKPQLVEGDQGYVAVNTNQPGVTRPVLGPDGQQLQKGQDMPSQFMATKVSNTQLGNKLSFASRLLKGEKIGEVQGDKDALLPIYGALPGAQDAAAYYKPEGIATRAAIADIGSQILLLRSGAAVSLDEYKRTKDFIPRITDSPKAVHDKIAYLQQVIKEENDAVDAVAKSMGFRTPRGLAPAVAQPTPPNATLSGVQAAKRRLLEGGQ
jgi:hypothetical protein